MALVEIPLVVEHNYAGWRLDRYLQEKLGRASRAQVQRIIRESLVQDGDRLLKPSSRVTAGLRVRILKEEPDEPAGLPDEVSVLYDEDDVLIIDKPAGLPVHPTARYYRGTVTTILGRDHRDALGRRPDPAHRLDRETSGVLVCGRTREMTRALKALFAKASSSSPRQASSKRTLEEHPGNLRAVLDPIQRSFIEKEYLAIVEGEPPWERRRVEHPLALTGEHRVRIRMSVVAPGRKGALPATTNVKVHRRLQAPGGERFALVACSLETGRQHQIRAHLQAEGLPIVGDKIYGRDETAFIRFTEGALTKKDLEMLRLPRHALHAWRIAFRHPRSGSRVEIEAPLPPDLRKFLQIEHYGVWHQPSQHRWPLGQSTS